MNIEIFTVTCGRPLYIVRLLESLKTNTMAGSYTHTIYFQGCYPTKNIEMLAGSANGPTRLVHLPKQRKIGDLLSDIRMVFTGNIMIKMDDDCVIRSPNFMTHVEALYRIYPNAVFSPFPVGLIGNLAGVPSSDRHVVYSKETDTYYTLRKVHHVGGFARISPKWLYDDCIFPRQTHGEDSEFSMHCGRKGVPMYYLENALIVEHQESTLGQHKRYGDIYFKGRE